MTAGTVAGAPRAVNWSTTIPDIAHYFGSDLQAGPTSDLLPVDGIVRGQQRVIPRLMTNPGDYIWHPTYGAGLPAFIGKPSTTGEIKAVVLQQMLLEEVVAPQPAPQVDVSFYPDGTFYVSITYTDALTGKPLLLRFNMNL